MRSPESVVEWFDRSALDFPEHVAVEDSAGQSVSYGELSRISRMLHARLQSAGVLPGDRVGVCMKKSIDTLIAFHGILRAGATYVPVDPLAPHARGAFILSDCDARAVLADEDLTEGIRAELEKLGSRPQLLAVPSKSGHGARWPIEALTSGESPIESVPRGGSEPAFLLYTSGSTGRPKAVILTHENVTDFVDWCSLTFRPSHADRFGTHSPLHFSLPVFNFYLAWKHGAAVVLIDELAAKSPQLVAPLIEKLGITVWFSTPTILSLLAQSGQLPSLDLRALRLVMFAGETFPIANLRSLKAQLPSDCTLVHILGSTETHIMAWHQLPLDLPADLGVIPIGTVSGRFRSQLIDDDGKPAAAGADGELCLVGPGVTPGYWKHPEATARAFFTDERGDRWYRTGDVVRMLPDGNLVYRGRRDRMIKKRGHRIELAEIEACLYTNAGVKEAAVVAFGDDPLGVRVKAFIVAQAQKPTIIGLKAHCAKLLPSYMVPDVFAFCDALPRTSTGKVDFPKLHEMT